MVSSARFGFITRIATLIAMFLLFAHFATAQEKTTIRFGHFPNITHAQGVIAHALSRQGKGWFEQRLGPNVEIQWFTYNAGPSAMEAIFARSLDVTYVGPESSTQRVLQVERGRDSGHFRCGQCRRGPGSEG